MGAMMSERFPDCISFGSSGGPSYRTTAIELLSGHEQRNRDWAYPRHIYNVGFGAKTVEDMQELTEFFNAASGRFRSFRYKDWLDFSSAAYPDYTITPLDQLVAVSDGSGVFQLLKNYTIGTDTQIRLITRPVQGTVVVAVNGTPTGASVNYDTGVITVAAGAGAVVTAGYEFDVPCRFESDALDSAFESHNNVSANLKVVEIREGPNAPLL